MKIKLSYLIGVIFVSVTTLNFNAFCDSDLILVKDINQNPRPLDIITRCTAPNYEIVFASDRIRGYELWLGDGVSRPAVMLKDINPGASSSFESNGCAVLGNTVFFSATNGTNGFELWKTDGTVGGTVIVKDIRTGTESSSPNNFIAANNKIFFEAITAAEGRELWMSDGTESGTVMLGDYWPGTGGGVSNEIFSTSTKLIFECSNLTIGAELCSYDLLGGGPVTAIDIRNGSSSSSPRVLGIINDKAVLHANVPATGKELYLSDGTLVGTTIIKDIYAGASSGIPSGFSGSYVVLNNKVYFEAEDGSTGREPYVSDGTFAGTSMLKDVYAGSGGSNPTSFDTNNNRVTFIASSIANGEEPWITDGTGVGTQILVDLEPGANSSSYGDNLHPLKGTDRSIYSAVTSADGFEYWGINSTSLTATRLANFFPGPIYGYYYTNHTSYPSELEIREPSPLPSVESDIVYLSDGTLAGTRSHPGALPSYTASSFPLPLGEMGGFLYFVADDGRSGTELWRTDGTAAGTFLVKEINAGLTWSVMSFLGGAVINDNTLLFAAVTEASGIELWKTDGTNAGTVMVKDIYPGPGSGMDSFGSKLISAGSYALFAGNNGTNGFELWRTDGTDAGTVMVQDIRPGGGDGYSNSNEAIFFNPTPSTQIYLFAADNGTTGNELYRYNGTNVSILEINAGAASSNPSNFTVWTDPQFVSSGVPYKGVLFSATTAAQGNEPYYLFPSLNIGSILKDVQPGASGSNPHYFVSLNPTGTNFQIYFAGNISGAGEEVIRYNQTPGNTLVVKDLVPGANSSYPKELAVLNSSTFVFGAYDSSGDHYNFYKSDGTSVGTSALTNVTSPDYYSPVAGVLVKDGIAYFSAYNDAAGNYLPYKSDGTIAGTQPFTSQGIYNNNYDLLKYATYSALNKVFFTLYSTSYGAEMFMVGEDQCSSDASKSFPGICGCGVADTDIDGDGTADCQDSCGSDPYKASPGICGCGIADAGDSDGDGALNCIDQCSADPGKSAPGICGCGTSDSDQNANGIADCKDINETPNFIPKKAKIAAEKKKKKLTGKIIISFESRPGADYIVLYREVPTVKRRGQKLPKFRTKNVQSGKKLLLKAPARGKNLEVKYKFNIKIGNNSYISKESSVAKYRSK